MSLIDFEFLFRPVEELDAWITGLFAGAPLLVALGIAFVLGLRHASDPDHLVAVTSLVAADDGGTRSATRLGAWWGLGHAAILVALGVPLIAFKSSASHLAGERRREGGRRGDHRSWPCESPGSGLEGTTAPGDTRIRQATTSPGRRPPASAPG